MDWSHAPLHRPTERGAYIVTSGTYKKARFLDSTEKLDFVLKTLFSTADEFGWRLEAWAIMKNHYHFIATPPDDPTTLKRFIQKFHSVTSIEINKMDGVRGRKVWFQYWDSLITFEKSYLARLNYVHHNPVRHRIVEDARTYPWCSAAWFAEKAPVEFRKKVIEAKVDKINVGDDY